MLRKPFDKFFLFYLSSFSPFHPFQVNGNAYAEGGSRGQRRTIIVRLGLIVEEVVDGRIDGDATPYVVLQHQLPDGVALVNVRAARLRLALTATRECGIEGIVAREPMVVA